MCKTGTVLGARPTQAMLSGSEGLAFPCVYAAVNYYKSWYPLLSYSLTLTWIIKLMLTFQILPVNYLIPQSRTPACLALFRSSHKTRLPSSGQATTSLGAGNALWGVCSGRAFPSKAINQVSRSKLNFALRCDVSLSITAWFSFQAVQKLSRLKRICTTFCFYTCKYPEGFVYSKSKGDIQLKRSLLSCLYI